MNEISELEKRVEALEKWKDSIANMSERGIEIRCSFVGDNEGGHIEFNGKVWRPVEAQPRTYYDRDKESDT